MRQQELKDEEERMQKRQLANSSSRSRSGEIEYSSIAGTVIYPWLNHNLQLCAWFLIYRFDFSLFCTCLLSSRLLIGCSLFFSYLLADSSSFVEGEGTNSPQYPSAMPSMRQPLPPRQNRYTLFHLDLLRINYSYIYEPPLGTCYKQSGHFDVNLLFVISFV